MKTDRELEVSHTEVLMLNVCLKKACAQSFRPITSVWCYLTALTIVLYQMCAFSLVLLTSVCWRWGLTVLSWNSTKRPLRSTSRYLCISSIGPCWLNDSDISNILSMILMFDQGWSQHDGQPTAEIQCQRVLLQSLPLSFHRGRAQR